MMTKIIKYFALCSIALLTACSAPKNEQKIITVTIEPQRYFAEQLVDSLFKIVTMVPPGTSPETYDPSPVQMGNLAKSVAYFCIGHIGFELQWMDKIRENNPQLQIFDNSSGIQLITSEEDAHDHDHDHAEEHHAHVGGVDPHIWSSPKEARIIARNMYEALRTLDAAHEDIYKQNLLKLEAEIAETDSILTDLFAKADAKSFIIYHPALTYLAKDYGLTQYCIEIDGKEPSPSQMEELIKTIKTKNTRVVFIQQEFDKRNAESIAGETGCKLVVINPLSYNWSEELIRIAQTIANEKID